MGFNPRTPGRRAFARVALAALPISMLVAGAAAENRKFVVFLADLSKEHVGSALQLPKRTDVRDAYFDKVKNSGPTRVDSFAEWWEEISYGDVTVDGDVGGWVSMPWPSHPPGLTGGLFSNDVTPHIDLQGGFSYQPGSGEPYNEFIGKFQFDFDGVGVNEGFGNFDKVDVPGLADVDQFGFSVWAPGERFQDLNGNRIYDAGVFEIGIDKDGDGTINVDDETKKATSWTDLIASEVDYGPPDQRLEDPIWIRFLTNKEWYDSNGNGVWDWGGTEIWIDRDGDSALGGPATQPDQDVQGPVSLIDFIIQVQHPDETDVEWWDMQANDNFDFPEPFEDFMRRWSADDHDFIPVRHQYIVDNYPGTVALLLERSGNGAARGNGLYDVPDRWGNSGNVASSNKGQEVSANLLDATEQAAQNLRWGFSTVDINSFDGTPTWWQTFWTERYTSQPPDWMNFIPYVRRFNPAIPIPQAVGQATQPEIKFEPNAGGPRQDGKPFQGSTFSGTVLPDIKNAEDGMYDGPAEYDDLPGSIYQSGGDEELGQVTSPANEEYWGQDLGGSGAGGDGNVQPGGPLAFGVHGDGGRDGGNNYTTEYLTWRTDGQSNTDIDVDIFGFIFRIYHRDVNLDGMMDLGETPVPGNHNYGIDCVQGGTPNADPAQNDYPFNRTRMMEDMIAAMDESMDFQEFLGGPGQFGNVINSVTLVPAGTGAGMFYLTAGSYQAIRVRDGLAETDVIRRDAYVPIITTDGLGISLDSAGEGDQFAGQGFQTAFSGHEYGHRWEGYPDLYDYDVYLDFGGANINHPIGRWCVMAGGGLVHPVPYLKGPNLSKWINPVDITTALTPASTTTINFPSWEFNRERTVFTYTNPTYSSELFYFWRQGAVSVHPDSGVADLTFDRNTPGDGLMIMHTDLRGNPNGVPTQQRLNGHFTWLIVQADGEHQLEQDNGTAGDAGDPFPGTKGTTKWNRTTDPDNRWITDEGSGLDIINIVENQTSTDVTFRWTPRELPSFDWVQPPGGTSVAGIYTLRYFAYDQRGGTTIKFYVDSDSSGYNGAFLSQTGKPPGDIDGSHGVNISGLPNGTYQFYAKLEPGATENSVSVPRANINNQGNGVLNVTNPDIDLAVSKLEVWTIRCTNDAVRNKEQWSVTGTLSGGQAGVAITGQQYQSDQVQGLDGQPHRALKFRINPGAKRFRIGDQFTFVTTGFTPYSTAVLIFDGEVVVPQPPIASIVSISPNSGLANWTDFTLVSGSSDPGDADFTEVWTFGDGTNSGTQTAVPSTVNHKFKVAGNFPVTLTVTNSFNLTASTTANVSVSEPKAPFARLTVSPTQGRAPVRVTLNGSASTDQNDPALGGSDLTYAWTLSDGTVLDPVAGTPAEGDIVVVSGPSQGPFDLILNKPGLVVMNMSVSNAFGKTATASAEVRVSGPPADRAPVAEIEADVRSGPGPLTITFGGGKSSDPEGTLLEYVWNFGDGSPLVRGVSSVQHTFVRAGTYNVTLTVTDGSKLKDSATMAIVVTADAKTQNGSPVARIITSATQGAAPFTVDFDAQQSGDPENGPLSYAWDFGDGSAPAIGAVVSHTFNEPRNYSVVLVVKDVEGAEGAATVTISVTLPAGESGRADPGTDDGSDEATTGPACGLFGALPIMMTLAGMAGLRRRYRR